MDAMTYQQSREKLLKQLEDLKSVYNDLSSSYPFFGNELPSDTARRLQFIDRDIVRLRNRDLVIAFVGGFSAGKSSLLNAFLGRYLLPESTEITTAVPTYVRCGSNNEYAEIHYLSGEETSELDGLYRSEIAKAFNMPELQNAPIQEILKKAHPLATDATSSWLIKNLEFLAKQKLTNPNFSSSNHVKRTVSIQEMQSIVRDEAQAMFIDHVEVNIKSSQLPSDTVLVDLPGVSVPNPRHRQATFKFIESAHAVVFVLLATRLFDRDESKVMEKICAGETRIVDKTFWVLNRWDALTLSQQELTRKDFKATMEKFSIQGYRYYTTNALHGLLAQLLMRGETSSEDDNLARHLRDYEQSQSAKSNETVLGESHILDLREAVLSFVNQKIRDMTLEIARENAEQNFCQPILHHLRMHKQSDDSLLGEGLQKTEREKIREQTKEHVSKRSGDLEHIIRQVSDKVVTKRSTLFADEKKLEEKLREEIKNGTSTDAFEVYKRLIRDNMMRKYPYYFEIEIYVVDSLNKILKEQFLDIAKAQVGSEVYKLIAGIRLFLESLNVDVNYDPSVADSFEELLIGVDRSLQVMVDNAVSERAPLLDELLVHTPSRFFSLLGRSSNAIVDGLEKAARMHNRQIRDTKQEIRQEDMDARTRQIRSTLENHYIKRTGEFRAEVADVVWTKVRDQLILLQKNLSSVIDKKYEPVLEQIIARQVSDEFAVEKTSIESRAKMFRESIERVENISREMRLSPIPVAV